MSFLNPLLLTALFAITIPIILHILYKRQVIRIDFSSIRFLKELQKNQLVKSSWLELIILLLRILTIACLVFAFSNPISQLNLPFSLPVKTNHFIFPDYNEALRLNKAGVTLKQKLIETVQIYLKKLNLEDDLYWIDPFTDEIEHIQKQDLLSRLIDLNNFHTDTLALESIKNRVKIYIDENQLDPYSINIFSSQSIEKVPDGLTIFNISDEYDYQNAFIKSANFSSHIRLPNYPLDLIIDFSIPTSIQTFSYTVIIDKKTIYEDEIGNNQSRIHVPIASYENGIHSGEIRLTVDDDYSYDNSYFFTFQIADRQKILLLSDDPKTEINYYFQEFPDSGLQVIRAKTVESLSYEWTNYDYVFYEGQMPIQSVIRQINRYISQSTGTLILIPSADFDFDSWNRTSLKQIIEFTGRYQTPNQAVNQYFLEDRDFRESISYSSNNQNQSKETISLHTGLKAKLSQQEIIIGNQKLQLLLYNQSKRAYTFMSPLQQSANNFVTDTRFVPVIYSLLFTQLLDNRIDINKNEIIIFSKSYQAQLTISAGKNYSLTALKRSNNQTKYSLPDRIESGNYSYEIDQRNHILSINKSALKLESLSTENKEFVAGWEVNSSSHSSSSLWRLFLILALLFYLTELWLGKASYKSK